MVKMRVVEERVDLEGLQPTRATRSFSSRPSSMPMRRSRRRRKIHKRLDVKLVVVALGVDDRQSRVARHVGLDIGFQPSPYGVDGLRR